MSSLLFDAEVAFDIVYSQFGGRWRFTDGDTGFHMSLLRYADSIPAVLVAAARDFGQRDGIDAVIPDMHFGLLDTQSLNCFATQRGSRHFVGVSGMLPVALLELAAHFFATSFLPEIGDTKRGPLIILDGFEEIPFFQLAENRFRIEVSREMPDREADSLFRSLAMVRGAAGRMSTARNGRLGAQKYIEQFDPIISYLLPRCPIRREHVHYCVNIVVHFFWLHEISHVTRGHLRVLQERYAQPNVTLFEFPDSMYSHLGDGNARVADQSLLAMELDADVEAALLTVGLIMKGTDIETDDFPYVDKYGRVKLFCFMLIGLFGALAKQADRHGLPESATHPPAKIRLLNLYKYLSEFGSHDAALEAAVRDGVTLAHSYGRYTATQYLRSVLDFDEADWSLMTRIDEMRAEFQNYYDRYGYGTLRVLARSFIQQLPFQAPPHAKKSEPQGPSSN